jgi:hypothetical protein
MALQFGFQQNASKSTIDGQPRQPNSAFLGVQREGLGEQLLMLPGFSSRRALPFRASKLDCSISCAIIA